MDDTLGAKEAIKDISAPDIRTGCVINRKPRKQRRGPLNKKVKELPEERVRTSKK